MMLSITIPTYDKSQNILYLLTPIYPKVKPESSTGELVVIDDNLPRWARLAVMEEAHARYIRTLPSVTSTAVRSAVNGYENDSRGEEGIINYKNYLIKTTHRTTTRYGLISAFQLRGIRKPILFFSKSARFCTVGASGLLTNHFISSFLENGLVANFSYIYTTLVGMICAITSNLLINKIWVLGKKYGGRSLLQFRSLF